MCKIKENCTTSYIVKDNCLQIVLFHTGDEREIVITCDKHSALHIADKIKKLAESLDA